MNSAPASPSRDRSRVSRAGRAAERFREVGLRLTPQRLAVLRALILSGDHPSPEALFARVRAELPSLSLATVYKALEALTRFGLARGVPVTGNTKRYDANLEPHHHLLCIRCHAVQDSYDRRLDRIAPPRRLPGFRPSGVSVQIHGLCSACARAARASQSPDGPGGRTKRRPGSSRKPGPSST